MFYGGSRFMGDRLISSADEQCAVRLGGIGKIIPPRSGGIPKVGVGGAAAVARSADEPFSTEAEGDRARVQVAVIPICGTGFYGQKELARIPAAAWGPDAIVGIVGAH